ncbi:MAG TPA: VWA domain-containing protein [Pyrinomonadaceae bacterium]|nr:VWA domain-containing protein [Pyrinomonadaceae bacterium]
MKKIHARLLLLAGLAALLFQMYGGTTPAQQQTPGPAQPKLKQQADEDVVRISTELVQTGVSVFDRQGKFVEGLNKEDFELKVDGRPVDVSFFERITSGSAGEEEQITTARSPSAKWNEPVKDALVAKPPNRGRVIIFFVDDIHMAFDSLARAKANITRFIDREMSQNDLVAVTSSSGQIGFLQQYTDNKDVLRMAVSRLNYRNFGTRDIEAPIMTDGQAVLITQGDKLVTGFFVGETMRILSVPQPTAEALVRMRARILSEQTVGFSKATLSTLETLTRRAAGLPGRKLVFFISDGFPLNTTRSNTSERLQQIADASIRAGVIIYTLDSRGLVTDMMDATVESPPTGYVAFITRTVGEDVLSKLAADTGGRFVHNTNDLGPEITKALKDTSVYYLLAWRPSEERSGKKFRRIQIRVKNRPELSVRVQRGYFDDRPEDNQKDATNAKNVDPLRKAIDSLFPKRDIPTRLALTYMDTTVMGSLLVASMKVDAGALRFEQEGRAPAALIDITGTIYDAKGKALESFRHRLTVTPPASAEAKPPDIVFNYRATLKPGLYHVRVAAVDRASGLTGSAREWVEIPDLVKERFTLSSLIVGERKPGLSVEQKTSDAWVEGMNVSVDRRFDRSSNLRYLIYVYNAARGRATAPNSAPKVTLQAQIFRGDQLVVTMPPREPSPEPQDPAHLAYAAEIPLQALRAGHYVLQLTAIDRVTNARASQTVGFEVQ